jgi:hypothetical protein
MLKSLIAAAAAIGLMASPVAAAGPTIPAEETVEGQQLFDSYASPLIVFVLIVALGTGLAFLIDGKDEPTSP